MSIIKNPFRGTTSFPLPTDTRFPSVHVDKPLSLLKDCPAHAQTPLVNVPDIARATGIAEVFMKDERARMALGSFKALGAAYVIAHEANQAGAEDMSTALEGRTFVTASAGNHGLSVAAGAKVFGANAIIYLSNTVPKAFGKRLEEKGATVRYEGDDYEASMSAAMAAAERDNLTLLSDTSWEGYAERPHRLMEGYQVLASEAASQVHSVPTHIFLQAGVGGLATAVAAYARHVWGDVPIITVVEPTAAPALQAAIEAGKFVAGPGPVSNMGRLDCKEASLIALNGLARDADFFMTISDEEAMATVERLSKLGIESTPSGIAGVAGLLNKNANETGLNENSIVMTVISEGPE